MKKFCTLLALFVTIIMLAQPHMFVHTATAETISGSASFMTHPQLDNNPDTKIIVTHNWNPPGSGGVYSNNIVGVYYSPTVGKWSVYHENTSAMTLNSSYNVYIAQESEVLEIAASTINPPANYLPFDYPQTNGDPDAFLAAQTYYNPNEVYNNKNYGLEFNYDGQNFWGIYDESFSGIPQGAGFFILVEGVGVQTMRHLATASNIIAATTTIDHPLLNNNPDAIVIVSHVYGGAGAGSQVDLNRVFGVFYNEDINRWAVFFQNLDPMIVGAAFNLFIYDPSLNVEETSIENISFYPNPVLDIVTISAKEIIDTITLYDMQGRLIQQLNPNSANFKMNIAHLATGNYIAKVKAGNASQSLHLVKK